MEEWQEEIRKLRAQYHRGAEDGAPTRTLREHPTRRAIKTSWKTHRMPRTRTHIDLVLPLTAEEFELLAWGHIPAEIEDHWFMYFDGEAFCFHRTWTGYCIYRVYVRECEGGSYETYRVTVNRSKKQYREERDEPDAIEQADVASSNGLNIVGTEGIFRHVLVVHHRV